MVRRPTPPRPLSYLRKVWERVGHYTTSNGLTPAIIDMFYCISFVLLLAAADPGE